jgi:hypothetical protein
MTPPAAATGRSGVAGSLTPPEQVAILWGSAAILPDLTGRATGPERLP